MAITLRAPRGLSRLAAPLRALVRSTLAAEGRRAGEIGIVLARDADLRALNRSWRGIDRATDVLSFGYDGNGSDDGGAERGEPLRDALATRGGRRRSASRGARRSQGGRSRAGVAQRLPALRSPAPGQVTGDLVISLDRVIQQARRYRVTRGRELARLAVHGTLHLAGLDHQRAAERRRMRRREDRALHSAAPAVRALDRVLRAESPR